MCPYHLLPVFNPLLFSLFILCFSFFPLLFSPGFPLSFFPFTFFAFHSSLCFPFLVFHSRLFPFRRPRAAFINFTSFSFFGWVLFPPSFLFSPFFFSIFSKTHFVLLIAYSRGCARLYFFSLLMLLGQIPATFFFLVSLTHRYVMYRRPQFLMRGISSNATYL